jgi:hypothetical protein
LLLCRGPARDRRRHEDLHYDGRRWVSIGTVSGAALRGAALARRRWAPTLRLPLLIAHSAASLFPPRHATVARRRPALIRTIRIPMPSARGPRAPRYLVPSMLVRVGRFASTRVCSDPLSAARLGPLVAARAAPIAHSATLIPPSMKSSCPVM